MIGNCSREGLDIPVNGTHRNNPRRAHSNWVIGGMIWPVILLFALAAMATMACGSDATPTAEPVATPVEGQSDADGPATADTDDDTDAGKAHDNGDSDASSSSSGEDSSEGHDNGDSGVSSSSGADSAGGYNGDSGGGDSSDTDTVSRENPGFVEVPFDYSRNLALLDAEPLDLVTWTVGPSISPGELVAEGTLKDGAILFNPMVDGEGSGFSVFYKGHDESMVELLPDLGPLSIWDTDLTVAETEMETEGANFRIRAYSPLFMDVGGSDLEIRVIGYDQAGNDAVLGVQDIGVE